MASKVLPRVQAMVLCDAAKKDDLESDVFHLSGIRSTIGAASFPALCPRLCVFMQMSGHEGEISCHVEVNRIETGDVIFDTSRRVIAFKGPLFVVPVVFRIRNCVFPAPGVYYVQVFDEDKLIGERSLRILEEV